MARRESVGDRPGLDPLERCRGDAGADAAKRSQPRGFEAYPGAARSAIPAISQVAGGGGQRAALTSAKGELNLPNQTGRMLMSTPMDSNLNALKRSVTEVGRGRMSVAAAAPFAPDFRGNDKLTLVLAERGGRAAPVIVATDAFQTKAGRLGLGASRSPRLHVTIAPLARRRGSFLGVMDRVAKLMTAVVVGALVIGQSSFSALAQQGGDRPRLLGWASPLTSGEPAPLGLTLRGQTDDAVVVIMGLVPGMTLSVGSKIAVDTWQIPATALRNVWIVPPTNFVGVVDLVAELHLADRTTAD